MENSELVINYDGETLVAPETVSDMITEAVGAEYSLRQVARLGDNRVLEPIVIKRRRWYRLYEVEDLISRGFVEASKRNPNLARLVRSDVRESEDFLPRQGETGEEMNAVSGTELEARDEE